MGLKLTGMQLAGSGVKATMDYFASHAAHAALQTRTDATRDRSVGAGRMGAEKLRKALREILQLNIWRAACRDDGRAIRRRPVPLECE
ncbi:MAG: hypothetical protein JWQ73_2092 [Variovorax sp.]|nr:hypothetical protein [Variovorax sp.]